MPAAGAGTIPWHLDLDRLEEDWFHLLVAPPAQPAPLLPGALTPSGSLTPPGWPTLPGWQPHSLSVAGARMLAGELRDTVGRRHALAVARVGRSQACPLDLHALVPVPDAGHSGAGNGST